MKIRLLHGLFALFALERRRGPSRIEASRLPALLGFALAASCNDSGHIVATALSTVDATTPNDGDATTPNDGDATAQNDGDATAKNDGDATAHDGGDSGEAGPGDASSGSQICLPQVGAPPGVAPLPSAPQVAYQRTEVTAFMHFGLDTFDGTEHGSSMDSPSLFNPSNLDAGAWVSALANAGFRQATLVVKHDTGFCLWPSAYTTYSVKSSPWKGGQGDVVREFTDAMRAAGMRVGLYVSPLDQHYPSTSASYETYFRNQLTELLSNYGPVAELFVPGNSAPASVDWSGIWALAKQIQPDVLIMAGPPLPAGNTGIRFVGYQNGQASRSTSSVASIQDGGAPDVWYPVETPVSDRGLDWFWHSSGTVVSLASVETMYFATVAVNTTLLLNFPPSTTGQFDTADLNLLAQFGGWYASLLRTNLLRGQTVSADSTWKNAGFEAARAVDDDICTYWAAAAGKTSARLEVTPASAITFHVISIREPIELGERSTGYHVEIHSNGAWNTSPVDASGAVIAGTVIGQRQLWNLHPTTADAVALVIDSAKDVPAIAEFSVY